MKISQPIIFFIAILCNVEAFSQQTGENPDKLKFHLSDIYFTSGLISQPDNKASLTGFQNILPQSVMLHSDLAGYSPNSGWGSTTSTVYSLMSGFRWGESQKSSLRLGLSYYFLNYANAEISKHTITPTDTFTSSQTGEELYVSKVTSQWYSMHIPSQQLRLEAAYLYNILPQKRISFYTGFGAAGSVSLNANADINYSEFSYTRTETKSGEEISGRSNFYSNGPEGESHNIDANYGVMAFIPLGLDFQLTRQGDNLLQRTHIIYEFRPGINAQYGPLGNFTALQWQHNLGLRLALN